MKKPLGINQKNKIDVIIPARNEEEFIGKTLRYLMDQTVKLNKIIVIDDGSVDETAKIADRFNVLLVQLPNRKSNAVGKPALASVINAGLQKITDTDYTCILGADHLLPPNYFREVIDGMKRDPRIVMASGIIQGEPYNPDFPWGSGRIIRTSFFREIGFRFPVEYGWEDWIVYKAKKLGLKTKCFRGIVSEVQRSMSFESKGEIMYALGYDWKYALGRCFKGSLKSPGTGINMLKGWLFHKGVKRLDDIAEWVNQYQKNLFWKETKRFFEKRSCSSD